MTRRMKMESIIFPGWPDVLLPRPSQPSDRRRLQSDKVFIILGSALRNAKQFPHVNLDQGVTPEGQENRKSPISIVSEIQWRKWFGRAQSCSHVWNTPSRPEGFTNSRQWVRSSYSESGDPKSCFCFKSTNPGSARHLQIARRFIVQRLY